MTTFPPPAGALSMLSARRCSRSFGSGSRCGSNDDYDMDLLWNAQEDIRSLKFLILFGVRGMAAYAHHTIVLSYTDEEANRFFAKALFAIGEDWVWTSCCPS